MTTALYRRYRPETFADVIGQEHVTGPLMQALRTGRINHAYLFSGPRGCGKTTSARILARCLNCEQGPTPTPCGVCESCVALARGGPGSIDVIEIDAASHGGVDDARDLRERASYGPAQSRYKVYIIDEAHMVTPQGFNALLKIVEEPPEHVKFVFATTEPEKVIGTIRSRTHHYPFRLVPPLQLTDYLQRICQQEQVPVAPGVLGFVTRAGGGSVRDSLSVLDQLISGSGDDGLTYDGAAALLGFTDGELLDATIDAFAAGDGAAVFVQVDRVIESGHDPRRFVEDLLERLRDLIVVAAVPEGVGAVLRGVPEDQLQRMRGQQSRFGPGTLSRAADIVNTGLTEMTGATAPRLQLELICARILLPAAAGEQGYAARLERLERRLDLEGAVSTGPTEGRGGPGVRLRPVEARPAPSSHGRYAAEPPPPPEDDDIEREWVGSEPVSTARQPESPRRGEAARGETAGGGEAARGGEGVRAGEGAPGGLAARGGEAIRGGGAAQGGGRVAPTASVDEHPTTAAGGPRETSLHVEPAGAPAPSRDTAEGAAVDRRETGRQDDRAVPVASTPPASGMDLAQIRRVWPDVLARIFAMRRATWTFVSQHAQVQDYDGSRLVLGIATVGLANTFRAGNHAELVRQALIDEIGIDVPVEGVPSQDVPPAREFADPAPPSRSPARPGPAADAPSPVPDRAADRPGWGQAATAAPDWASEPTPAPAASEKDSSTSHHPTASPAPGSPSSGPGSLSAASGSPSFASGTPSSGPVSPSFAAGSPSLASGTPSSAGRSAASAGSPPEAGEPSAPSAVAQAPSAPPHPSTATPAGPDARSAPPRPATPAPQPAEAPSTWQASTSAAGQAASVRQELTRVRQAAAGRSAAPAAHPGPRTGRPGIDRDGVPGASPAGIDPADDAGVSDDDEDFAPSGAVGREVIERVLGGRFLGEFED